MLSLNLGLSWCNGAYMTAYSFYTFAVSCFSPKKILGAKQFWAVVMCYTNKWNKAKNHFKHSEWKKWWVSLFNRPFHHLWQKLAHQSKQGKTVHMNIQKTESNGKLRAIYKMHIWTTNHYFINISISIKFLPTKLENFLE